MAIFSRRSIQRFLDSNRQIIGEELTSSHVNKLNREDGASLHTEWEVALIYCLSKQGEVKHETNLGGTSNLDILFKSSSIEFAGDISTVSDKNQHANNNYNAFLTAISEAAKKIGLDSISGLHVDVKGKEIGEYPRRKIELRLPKRNEFNSFINLHIKPFLLQILKFPEKEHRTNIATDEVAIGLSYNPEKLQYVSGGYPSYTAVYAIQNNTLYNRLKTKSNQLKKSGYRGLKGVMLCDGFCDAISTELVGTSYTAQDIVEHYLRNTSTIDFVFLIHVNEKRNWMDTESSRELVPRLYFNSSVDVNTRRALHATFSQCLEHLPAPLRTAQNAVNILEGSKNGSLPGDSFYGGYSMNGNAAKFSLRTLIQLLSGDLLSQNFVSDHKELSALFKNKLNSGFLPSSIEIEHGRDKDDDWVVFNFSSKKDPSLEKYK